MKNYEGHILKSRNYTLPKGYKMCCKCRKLTKRARIPRSIDEVREDIEYQCKDCRSKNKNEADKITKTGTLKKFSKRKYFCTHCMVLFSVPTLEMLSVPRCLLCRHGGAYIRRYSGDNIVEIDKMRGKLVEYAGEVGLPERPIQKQRKPKLVGRKYKKKEESKGGMGRGPCSGESVTQQEAHT